jgi:hypothetical protein
MKAPWFLYAAIPGHTNDETLMVSPIIGVGMVSP